MATTVPKKRARPSKKKIKDMDVDEFMSTGFLNSDDEAEEQIEEKNAPLEKKKKKKPVAVKGGSHKDDLAELEKTDPEFFQFLKSNDQKLLEFSESDESEEDEYEEDEREMEKKVKDGGEEEPEKDDEEYAGKPVTMDIIKQWEKQLKKFSIPALHQVTRALACAVSEMSGVDCDINDYSVHGEREFNRVVELCLTYGTTVLTHHIPEAKGNKKSLASSHHNWSKVRSPVRLLLTNLLTLTKQLTDKTMLVVLLKQIEQLTRFYVCFPKMLKSLVKVLILLWSESTDSVRIVAFLSLRKLAVMQSTKFLNSILKRMYLSFVANSKFTSPKARPLIVLMENCLVEMYNLDHQTSYQHGFVYIRQLAVHLRTAMVQQKKILTAFNSNVQQLQFPPSFTSELLLTVCFHVWTDITEQTFTDIKQHILDMTQYDAYQAVYNWQYIHCIELWCRVLADCMSETLKPLIYPVVQTTLGVIRLIPTSRYYPLRFHCIHFLNMLSDETNTLIPVAPLILEVLDSSATKKRPRPSTSKPVSFSYILRVSKSQLQTKAFQDSVFDNVLCLLMEYFSLHSHSIAFPELILPATIRLRKFVKQSKAAQFCRQIKQLVDKLEETGAAVTAARSSVSFSPRDTAKVNAWEIERRQKENSLVKYFSSWKQMQKLKNTQSTAENELDEEMAPPDTSSDEEDPHTDSKSKRKKLDETKVEKKTITKQQKKSTNFRQKRALSTRNKPSNKDKLESKDSDVVEDFQMWSDED